MLDGAKNLDNPDLWRVSNAIDVQISRRLQRRHERNMAICIRCFWIALVLAVVAHIVWG